METAGEDSLQNMEERKGESVLKQNMEKRKANNVLEQSMEMRTKLARDKCGHNHVMQQPGPLTKMMRRVGLFLWLEQVVDQSVHLTPHAYSLCFPVSLHKCREVKKKACVEGDLFKLLPSAQKFFCAPSFESCPP